MDTHPQWRLEVRKEGPWYWRRTVYVVASGTGIELGPFDDDKAEALRILEIQTSGRSEIGI